MNRPIKCAISATVLTPILITAIGVFGYFWREYLAITILVMLMLIVAGMVFWTVWMCLYTMCETYPWEWLNRIKR